MRDVRFEWRLGCFLFTDPAACGRHYVYEHDPTSPGRYPRPYPWPCLDCPPYLSASSTLDCLPSKGCDKAMRLLRRLVHRSRWLGRLSCVTVTPRAFAAVGAPSTCTATSTMCGLWQPHCGLRAPVRCAECPGHKRRRPVARCARQAGCTCTQSRACCDCRGLLTCLCCGRRALVLVQVRPYLPYLTYLGPRESRADVSWQVTSHFAHVQLSSPFLSAGRPHSRHRRPHYHLRCDQSNRRSREPPHLGRHMPSTTSALGLASVPWPHG